MALADLQQIEGFLKTKRIAMVGVSRNPKDFSRTLYAEFLKRGYDAVPVNPHIDRIDDLPCYPKITSIEKPVEAALILTPSEKTAEVCADCIAARVPRVWMYCAIGSGAVDPKAAERCRRAGIDVIEGHCPFMFFEKTAWFHRAHAGLLIFLGQYPRPYPKTKGRGPGPASEH